MLVYLSNSCSNKGKQISHESNITDLKKSLSLQRAVGMNSKLICRAQKV